ncbi:MAG: deoxyhypusine synthase [Candidatus Hodarchaeaceae archaeon]|nr:deoxyhypusine synthase [Candidatus Hodarchaeaceae archaeon]
MREHRKIEHVGIKPSMRVGELVREMGKSGVFGAGRIAEAADVYRGMVDSDATIFMGLGGALVAGGLRQVITKAIKHELVDVIVTTGANVVHDLIEAFGGHHLRGEPFVDDARLRERGVSRIYDTYVPQRAFELFEDRIQPLLREVTKHDTRMSSAKLLREIGLRLRDRDSFIGAAAKRGVPVFAPALVDSIFGIQAWLFAQDHEIVLDGLLDMKEMIELAHRAENSGALLLGGGVPKNFIFQSKLLAPTPFRYAIQITMDRPEHGGLSGATLEEAKSWGKVAPDARLVTVIGDATAIFPMLIAAVLARGKRKKP